LELDRPFPNCIYKTTIAALADERSVGVSVKVSDTFLTLATTQLFFFALAVFLHGLLSKAIRHFFIDMCVKYYKNK
jgi:hypothetical protein